MEWKDWREAKLKANQKNSIQASLNLERAEGVWRKVDWFLGVYIKEN